jgi:hypothetical protein
MPRKYKMPRTYKSPETYQRFIDGAHKGGNTPKNITPKTRERLSAGGKIGGGKRWLKNTTAVSENK